MTGPLKEAKLQRVDSPAEAAAFYVWLAGRDYITCDTETTGLTWYKPDFRVRLVQFGGPDHGFVFRVDRFGYLIEDVLANFPGVIVGHNFVGFDSHALRAAGFTVPPMHRLRDSLMMSRIVDSRGSHGLKPLSVQHLGPEAGVAASALDFAFKKLGYKDKGQGFAEISYDVMAYSVYSAVDVVLTARLYELLWPQIESGFLDAYEREMAAWDVTAEHESKGLNVDLAYTAELAAEYEDRIEILRGQLQALGIANPNSKTQRLDVLYTEGFVPEEFTETGEPILDKAALEKLASPTALLLIEFGRLSGWLTKYIYKVRDDSHNGIVYPSFNPFGARTGRQSAYGPPVQQLPGRHEEAHKIRRMFVARPGEELWSIDYDAEENRLLAHFSQDENLLRLIREGKDIHRYTAAVVYGIPEDEITKQQRTLVKNVVYAEQYGAGVKKMAKMLDLPFDEVARIRDGIKAAYPGVARWKQQLENEAKIRWNTEGAAYALTWGGRRVYADQFAEFEPKYYTLANYILQGSGADVLKAALNRIAAAGVSHYIYLPVHDELLFSLPPDNAAELAAMLARLMTFDTEFAVPLTCSPERLGESWLPH